MKFYFPLVVVLLLIASVGESQPPARHLERIAYDQNRDKLIVFGGSARVDNQLITYNTVHEWGADGWKEISVPGPKGRNGGVLVYHEKEKVTYVMGGVFEDQAGYEVLFDVWTWDGKTWKELDLTCPVKEPEGVYSRENSQLLVYGEVTNKDKLVYDGERKFELWALKNGKWKKLSDAGPAIPGSVQMGYDVKRKSLLVPLPEGDQMVMWEWRNNSWTKSTCSDGCPPARSRFAFAYSPSDQKAFLHGGRDTKKEFLNDVWQWDGEHWKEVSLQQPLSAKASARLVYGKNSLLEFGGAIAENGKTITINELWELGPLGWKKWGK